MGERSEAGRMGWRTGLVREAQAQETEFGRKKVGPKPLQPAGLAWAGRPGSSTVPESSS